MHTCGLLYLVSRMSLENPTRSNTPERAFNTQFDKKEFVDVPGGQIEIVDVSPEKLKTEVPVLFLSGSHNAPESYEKTLEGIVEHGRRIVSLVHPRNEDMPNWEPTASKKLLEENPASDGGYRTSEIRKVHNVEAVIMQKELQKVDIVAHSEGSLYGLIFALEHPQQIRNIILVAPAGMEGEETIPEVGLRIGIGMLKEAFEKLQYRLLKSGAYQEPPNSLSPEALKRREEYIRANKHRWEQEKKEMTNFHIDPVLYELRKEYGIGISIVQGVNDSPVSSDKMQKNLKKGSVDGFYSLGGAVPGKHRDVIEYPEKLSWLIDHALSALEQKQAMHAETK